MTNKNSKKPIGSRSRRLIKVDMEIPVTLERILLDAASDPRFCDALLSDRKRALEERGFNLTPSEQAMLSQMTRSVLESLIERFRPEKLNKSRFARQVAAAVTGSMILVSASCTGADDGVGPDWPEDAGKEFRDTGQDANVDSDDDAGTENDE